jgi:hypothetical protein
MRRAAAAAIALSIAAGGCAMQDDGLIALSTAEAGDAYRTSMCRLLPTDGVLDAALTSGDADAILEAARTRGRLLSSRNVTVSEQHSWPTGADVWAVDQALADELEWVLEVANAPSPAAAGALPRPAPDRLADADAEVRAALELPADDAELCG